jgi:hypothetical protein
VGEEKVVEAAHVPDPPGKRTKVAIVGFAPSWKQAPWDDLTYEIWTLNEAYKLANEVPRFRADRWFELHSRASASKATAEHQAFLRQCPVPVYMWSRYPDIPNSVRFPKDEIVEWLRRKGHKGAAYFTNSISWMVALALYEGFKTIALYGVDLANDSEYSFQRPSCEYFIGIAEGAGVEVIVPPASDLLKCTQLYGFESDNRNRVWIKTQMGELDKRGDALSQQLVLARETVRRLEIQQAEVRGARSAYYEVLKRTQ